MTYTKRWPNESDEYRAAREALLAAEVELRAKTEEVAQMRAKLPAGGAPKEDYVFVDARSGAEVRLSELFAPGKDSLVLYGFMFGRAQTSPCPACTSLLDGLNGSSPHLNDKINFAVVAAAEPAALLDYADERGWGNLRLLSSAGNTYNRDYGAETDEGAQLPMMHSWARNDGEILHFWASELLLGPDPDWPNHPRHVDAIWPLWNLFDLTADTRYGGWFPKLSYD